MPTIRPTPPSGYCLRVACAAALSCLSIGSVEAVAATALAEDDAAWVARHLAGASQRSNPDARAGAERVVERDDLSGLLGRPLRCRMRDGRTREGVLVAVDGSMLTLQSRVAGGAYRFSLHAGSVRQFIVH